MVPLTFSKQCRKCVEIDRLDEVVIEARLASATAVFFLAVTRDRDDEGVLARNDPFLRVIATS